MIFLSRSIFLVLCLTFSCIQDIEAIRENPSLYLSDEVWEDVQDYLIPDHHPIKRKLDRIFSRSRALMDQRTMVASGFDFAHLQPCTSIVVTRHFELPGYVIKAYLDAVNIDNEVEYDCLVKRIQGSRLIRESIKKHDYEHLLKVPEKWLYLLPDKPSPLKGYLRKMFILVEDDMDIYDDKKSEKL